MRLAQLVERPLDSRKATRSSRVSHTMELWIQILFALLALPGVFAMMTPLIPGIPYMFIIISLYGIIDKFQTFPWWYLILFFGFVITAALVDYFSGLLGARYGGARKHSLRLGFAGMVLGTLFFPPIGSFIGLFIGVLAGEIMRIGPRIPALLASGMSVAGALTGYFINIFLGISMYVLYLILMFTS